MAFNCALLIKARILQNFENAYSSKNEGFVIFNVFSVVLVVASLELKVSTLCSIHYFCCVFFSSTLMTTVIQDDNHSIYSQYMSAHQLGVIPPLRVDREVSNATISIWGSSLINMLVIEVLLPVPLGVSEEA